MRKGEWMLGKYMHTCTLRTLVWRGGAMVWQRARWFGVRGVVAKSVEAVEHGRERHMWWGACWFGAARALVRRGARGGKAWRARW